MNIERIVIRRTTADVLLIDRKWPKFACIGPDITSLQGTDAAGKKHKMMQVNDAGLIKFVVSNGWALYKLTQNQPYVNGFTIERLMFFVEGETVTPESGGVASGTAS
jgi:hypothetical protein